MTCRDRWSGYYRGGHPEDECAADRDRRALLAHIDAITEAVEGLRDDVAGALDDPETWNSEGYTLALHVRDVLALLRGTP